MRAAVYARLSRKKQEEELGINIADQQKIGQELADRRGWTLIAPPFTDDGRGAYKDDAKREEWDAMLAAAPDVIIVREAERLGRNIPDYARLLATKAKVVEWLDEETSDVAWEAKAQSTDTDEFAHKMVGARAYSRRMGAKISRKARLKAERGAWPHGGTRPFGYHHACCRDEKKAVICTYGEIIPAEAEIILEIAERWLAGEGLSALCRDLAERGVKSPANKPWHYARLRTMLAGPRIAGIRTYKGVETKGTWEPIVSEDLHRRLVVAEAESLTRRANINGTYILGPGLLKCARCDRNMYGIRTNRTKDGKTRITYACTEGCRQRIAGAKTEEIVIGKAFLGILAPELRNRDLVRAEVKELRSQVDDLEARLAELDAAYWEERTITKDRWTALSTSMTESLTETKARLTDAKKNLSAERDLPETAEDLGKRWAAADNAERCRLLRIAVECVVIHPNVTGKSVHDPTRIEIRFRDGRIDRISASDIVNE